jgi:excisionase family DNA binding protein
VNFSPSAGGNLPTEHSVGRKRAFPAIAAVEHPAPPCVDLRMATTLNTDPRQGAEIPFRLLDTTEAAATLGIGRRTLQELLAAREVACVKIGRSTRFDPADLAAYVDRNRRKASGWKGAAR